MTTWVDRVGDRRDSNQKIEVSAQHDFYWDHLGHEVECLQVVVNSAEVDPTTSDPLPVYGTQLVCHTCKDLKGVEIKSAVEISPVLTG